MQSLKDTLKNLLTTPKPAVVEGNYRFWPSTQGTLRNTRRTMRHQAKKMLPHLKSGRQWRMFRKGLKRQGADLYALPSNYILAPNVNAQPGVSRGAR